MKNSKKVLIACIAIAVIALGVYVSWRTRNGSTDFDTYYYAAKDILAGRNIYLGRPSVSPYLYPPFFACLIVPLAFLPIEAAAFVWYLATIAFFALSLLLSKEIIFPGRSMRDIWNSLKLFPKAVFIVVASGLFIDNITMLQANIISLFLILAGLYFFKNNKNIAAGLFTAAAISIKIVPLLFAAYFIVKKRFAAALAAAAFVLIFTFAFPSVFMGPARASGAVRQWAGGMLSDSMSREPNNYTLGGMFNPVNQSVKASLSRWLMKNDPDILFCKTKLFKYPSFMVNIGFLPRKAALVFSDITAWTLAIATFLFIVTSAKPAGGAWEFSLVFLAALFLNPLFRTPHFVFLLFPLLFLVSAARHRDRHYNLLVSGLFLIGLFYISLGVRVFRVLGFGTAALLLLWLMTLPIHKLKLNGEI